MTETRGMQVYQSLPQDVRPGLLALSVLIERIGSLPKPDRDDLFELLQEWRTVESVEDQRSIQLAMEEILAQAPITVRALGEAPVKSPKEQPWCDHVGRKIRDLRSAAGMTQGELAERAGLTQSHVSRIETAEHRPNHFTLVKIAKALNAEVGKIDPCVND
jgi:DNA-binding XRE family transcriptional regulator